MTLTPGEALGRYQILAQLGSGGMATVYKAYQPSLDRVVALKVLRDGSANEPEFVERFHREAKAVAQLRHPNVVQIYDFDEIDGRLVMVMEHLEGGTLKAKLSELAATGGRLYPREIARIVGDVSEGLHYAHGLGIIHRDIKPSNILLTQDGRAVLGDFGIAKILAAVTSQHTQLGVGIGTPEYMSPEQGQGYGVDARSDIYALGVLIYEMFTGRVPFRADTPLAVVIAHARDPLPLPSEISPDIGRGAERVLLKALSKDPAARYENAITLSEALHRAIDQDELTPFATGVIRAGPVGRGPKVGLLAGMLTQLRAWRLPVARLNMGAVVFAAAIAGSGLVAGTIALQPSPSATTAPDPGDQTVLRSASPAPLAPTASSTAATIPSVSPAGSAAAPGAANFSSGTPAPATATVSARPTQRQATPSPVSAPTATLPPSIGTAAAPPAVATATLPTSAQATPYVSPTLDPRAAKVQVSGRVTSAVNGSGVSAVSVRIELASFCCDSLTTATTNASGNWSIALPYGDYRIRFDSPGSSGHAPQWWRSQYGSDTASVLQVRGADISGIDAILATGFLVIGRVLEEGGSPASAVYVFFNSGCCGMVGGVNPASDGSYAIRLPNGTYTASVGSGGRYRIPPSLTITVAGADQGPVNWVLQRCSFETGGGPCNE